MISADTTIARVLEEHPPVLDVLVGYHGHFERLRNRLLRKVMAPRVTVAQAAAIAGVPVDELLGVLRTAVGEAATSPSDAAAQPIPAPGELAARPTALEAFDDAHTVPLDVRDDIRRGEEPFARIMAAVRTLAPDQVLAVRVPFEPFPLYDVLGRRGLAHWTERRGANDWLVWFYRDGSTATEPRQEDPPHAPAALARTVVLDVRGLEPPHPMVRVLEALDRLGPTDVLEVHHERRPMFLYPQLDARGFVHDTDEPEPGFVRIRISRGKPS